MSKARQGYKRLIELKQEEILRYYRQYKDVISPFLILRVELDDLRSKESHSLMNEVDDFMENNKPKKDK